MNQDLNQILARQLRKLGLDAQRPPDAETWAKLLSVIDRTYHDADQDRYTLERSLAISSEEMQALYRQQKSSFEARLRALFGTIQDLVWLKDPYGVYLACNPMFERLLGATEAEIVGKTDHDFAGRGLADSSRESDRIATSKGGPSVTEEWVSFADDGHRSLLETIKTPMHDESGRFIGVIGIARDITERKSIEEKLLQRNNMLSAIIENFPGGISLFDADLRLAAHNDKFRSLMDLPDSLFEKPDLHFEDFIRFNAERGDYGPGDAEQQVAAIVGRARNFQSHRIERVRPNGVALEIRGEPLADGGFVTIYIDITERKLAEQRLRVAATAFESQEGMTITDAAKVILRVNRAFTKITGYSAEEIVGKTPSLLSSGRHDAAFYAAMWESIARTGSWQGEIWNRRKNGEVYPEWLSISAVLDEHGQVTNYVAAFSDITSRKAAAEEINNLAFYDLLTQLPNRRLLLDRLKQALASSTRNDRHGALLFIDLDNFKTLNDTLGHDIGDQLLQQVARRLATCVREGDTVARLGGDEFVVMLEDLGRNAQEAAAQTEIVGEKMLATLSQAYQLGSAEHRSTASIGATLFMDHQGTIDDLLKRADLAMYQAKAAGRNTLRFFDPEMQAVVTTRAALEADLREAVVTGQFLIHYQAQVVGEGRLTGAEALLRWQHPERGLMPPAEFIALAEETGLILPLGQWVLETACAQLATWAGRPGMAHLTVAVNVSARQFRHRDFVEEVLAVLGRTGANPQRLKLELTESLLVDDVEDVIAKMTALKARGVGFALDDFGTGYSSLSYLKRLPLDQLKIDQSFVRDILTDPNDAAIAKMVVVLAESLGLVVIAEGVEIDAQRDFLARHGCHAYQGYLFSRPLPLEEFEVFAKRP